MDMTLIVGLVVIAGMYWRQRRTSAHLRRKLTAAEQCHDEAIGLLTELTAECDAYRAEDATRERRRGLLRVVK